MAESISTRSSRFTAAAVSRKSSDTAGEEAAAAARLVASDTANASKWQGESDYRASLGAEVGVDFGAADAAVGAGDSQLRVSGDGAGLVCTVAGGAPEKVRAVRVSDTHVEVDGETQTHRRRLPSGAELSQFLERLRGVAAKAGNTDVGKAALAAVPLRLTRVEMRTTFELIRSLYLEKEGDVLDELLSGLRFPHSGQSANLRELALVTKALSGRPGVRAALPDLSALELLCLRQYTQKPHDIDRDVGWGDVPAADAAAAAVEEYEFRHQDFDWQLRAADRGRRNGSLFGPVCSALRDQGPGGARSAQSLDVLRKWAKWLCTVAAACSAVQDGLPTAAVYRGLGRLPAAVVDAHKATPVGDDIGWAALSSTSHDKAQSISYMAGTAANATAGPSADRPGTIFFTIRGPDGGLKGLSGRRLRAVSQYPTEDEVLLPPFQLLRVDAMAANPRAPFPDHGLAIEVTALGMLAGEDPAEVHAFLTRVRRDAASAAERLREVLRRRSVAAASSPPEYKRTRESSFAGRKKSAEEASLRAESAPLLAAAEAAIVSGNDGWCGGEVQRLSNEVRARDAEVAALRRRLDAALDAVAAAADAPTPVTRSAASSMHRSRSATDLRAWAAVAAPDIGGPVWEVPPSPPRWAQRAGDEPVLDPPKRAWPPPHASCTATRTGADASSWASPVRSQPLSVAYTEAVSGRLVSFESVRRGVGWELRRWVNGSPSDGAVVRSVGCRPYGKEWEVWVDGWDGGRIDSRQPESVLLRLRELATRCGVQHNIPGRKVPTPPPCRPFWNDTDPPSTSRASAAWRSVTQL
eukprot:TRINITY_DN21039_c0_g1_i1.p1 TRINITY_DN21039_c0_g1~~TRINITY_DN21039_c0_g1_i1.p1  ORF type:complete len:809 (+),score=245.97 TRINITY_DN21039_c0_g1_i1:1921-4347(+)